MRRIAGLYYCMGSLELRSVRFPWRQVQQLTAQQQRINSHNFSMVIETSSSVLLAMNNFRMEFCGGEGQSPGQETAWFWSEMVQFPFVEDAAPGDVGETAATRPRVRQRAQPLTGVGDGAVAWGCFARAQANSLCRTVFGAVSACYRRGNSQTLNSHCAQFANAAALLVVISGFQLPGSHSFRVASTGND